MESLDAIEQTLIAQRERLTADDPSGSLMFDGLQCELDAGHTADVRSARRVFSDGGVQVVVAGDNQDEGVFVA